MAPVAKQTLRLYDVLQGQAASVARLGGVHAMSDEQLASGGLRRRVAVLGMEGEELGRFRPHRACARARMRLHVRRVPGAQRLRPRALRGRLVLLAGCGPRMSFPFRDKL